MCRTLSTIAKILEFITKFPEGVPQSQLAKALGVSKSYLSLVLKNLEKQGLVYRIRVGNMILVKPVFVGSLFEFKAKVLKLGIVWSSEYLFLGYFAKLLKEKEGIELIINIYPSALQAVLALIRREVDATLSPMVTQIYGYLLSKGIVIVGGGASGGGYIYEIPHNLSETIISSEISTMDLCRAVALKKKYIYGSTASTRYFSSPREAIAMIRRRLAKYAIVWHPINIDVESAGGKKILGCSELEEVSHCCTFAVTRVLSQDIIERIAQIYMNSIELFNKDKKRFIDWYSATVGIEPSILKKALNEYTYTPELNPKNVSKVIETLGIDVPAKEYLYQVIQI